MANKTFLGIHVIKNCLKIKLNVQKHKFFNTSFKIIDVYLTIFIHQREMFGIKQNVIFSQFYLKKRKEIVQFYRIVRN